MAGSFTDGFEVEVLKIITGQASSIVTTTPLSAVYVALTTDVPTDSSAGTEVTGGGYARIDSKGKWATPSSGSVSTNADITFAAPTGNWGTVQGFNLYDALTGGNRLAWGDLTASKTISNGDQAPKFASGSLTITLT